MWFDTISNKKKIQCVHDLYGKIRNLRIFVWIWKFSSFQVLWRHFDDIWVRFVLIFGINEKRGISAIHWYHNRKHRMFYNEDLGDVGTPPPVRRVTKHGSIRLYRVNTVQYSNIQQFQRNLLPGWNILRTYWYFRIIIVHTQGKFPESSKSVREKTCFSSHPTIYKDMMQY